MIAGLALTLDNAGRETHALVLRYFLPVGDVLVTGQQPGCVVTPIPWYRWRSGVVERAAAGAAQSVDAYLLARMAHGHLPSEVIPLDALRDHPLVSPIATLAAVGALSPLRLLDDSNTKAWNRRRDLLASAQAKDPQNAVLWLAQACVLLHLGQGSAAADAADEALRRPGFTLDAEGLERHLTGIAREHGMPERFMSDAVRLVHQHGSAEWCLSRFTEEPSTLKTPLELTEGERERLLRALPLAKRLDMTPESQPVTLEREIALSRLARQWFLGSLMLLIGGAFLATSIAALTMLVLRRIRRKLVRGLLIGSGLLFSSATIVLAIAASSIPFGLGTSKLHTLVVAPALAVLLAGGLLTIALCSARPTVNSTNASLGWGAILGWLFAAYSTVVWTFASCPLS